MISTPGILILKIQNAIINALNQTQARDRMNSFDPAINYGPNDAGISAFSIALVILALIVGSWLLGTGYTFIANTVEKLIKKKK
tara:strand:- start:282 stop:533 length:252 start_codon:yes stop_codon:yes gene_type:complete